VNSKAQVLGAGHDGWMTYQVTTVHSWNDQIDPGANCEVRAVEVMTLGQGYAFHVAWTVRSTFVVSASGRVDNASTEGVPGLTVGATAAGVASAA
jgi:hypothetical protein